MSSEPFNVRVFLKRLRDVGCSLGEPFHYFTATSSTNDEAKLAATRGAPAGATFLADYQSAGRGRHGRQWVAAPNQQILASVIWRPRTPLADAALTLAVGVALHRALSQNLPKPSRLSLKWPNDLESEARKVGGVLVEGGATPDYGPHVIVGFGLNVQPVAPQGATQPLSLTELGSTVGREELLVQQLVALGRELTSFETVGLASVIKYLNAHHGLTGQTVEVDGVLGVVKCVSPTGALVLETAAGERQVTSGTVERKLITP